MDSDVHGILYWLATSFGRSAVNGIEKLKESREIQSSQA